MANRRVQFPEKMAPLFQPKRYKVARGGRGSMKSWQYARALVMLAASRSLRMLCVREFQLSITESVHKLLCDQIAILGLTAHFDIQKTIIRARGTNSEFIFAGIRTNPNKIKSTEGVDIVWVEEAEKVSKDSWEILIPTIRKEGSEIWITYNQHEETDPTHVMVETLLREEPDSIVCMEMSWRDNPWLSDVLRREKDYLYRVDPEAAAHVWGGGFRKRSKAQVLSGKWTVEGFVPGPDWNGPYFGVDWGGPPIVEALGEGGKPLRHPTAMVKLWIRPARMVTKTSGPIGPCLMVEHEAYGCVENNELATLFEAVPGARQYLIRADNARPETIHYVADLGFHIQAAKKWPGSLEDGIAHLRQYERIIIHPRCIHAEQEARLWSYKIDKLSGDVLPVVVELHDNIWAAARYALEPLISAPEVELVSVYEENIVINNQLDEYDLRERLGAW